MRSLKINDGDLALGPHGYAEVTGPRRIYQDFKIASMTPLGQDRFHPRWGTLLPAMIGRASDQQTSSAIKSEVVRIINNYMLVMADLQQTARNNGQRSPFGANDLIASIESVTVTQVQTSFVVVVTVKTVGGQSVTVASTLM